MCRFEALGVSWPPRGWKQLGHIKKTSGQAITKDPASAQVTGLVYNIDPTPVYRDNNRHSIAYAIHIDGWEYTIHNESREYPVLSFMLQERPDPATAKNLYISNIKTKSRPVRVTERSAHRCLMAALFMMKQINGEQVPDIERVLRLYKIHPSQRSLYNIDNEQQDGFYPEACDFHRNVRKEDEVG